LKDVDFILYSVTVIVAITHLVGFFKKHVDFILHRGVSATQLLTFCTGVLHLNFGGTCM
jgi:hypothetical protein